MEDETKCKNFCYASLFGIAAAWTLALATLTLWRADNAQKIDSYYRDQAADEIKNIADVEEEKRDLGFGEEFFLEGLDYSSVNFYDTCSRPEFDTFLNDAEALADASKEWADSCDLSGVTGPGDLPSCYYTNWKSVFTLSGTVLFLMSCNFFILAVGSFCFWPRLIGTYINCGLAILNIATAIFAIESNTKPASIVCSYNIAYNTFKGDG